jgi:hypothetical protein
MNDFEQILIRMGVDARAVVGGLNQVGAYARGWAASLITDLQGKFGRFISAVGFITIAEGQLEKMKEETMEVARLSDELQASTNFVQYLQKQAERTGIGIESLVRPLVVFNREVGNAKRGLPDAIERLSDMGVISNRGQLAALSYAQAMQNLKGQFDKIGDAAKQDALLNEAFGNSAYRVAFLFRESRAQFNEIFDEENGPFFTGYTMEGISETSKLFASFVSAWRDIRSTTANVFGSLVFVSRTGIELFGQLWKNQRLDLDKAQQSVKNIEQDQLTTVARSGEAQSQDIEVQQQKADIISNQNQLLERQTELTAEIIDRNKSSISEMADQARRRLGIPTPREYGVSARERQALRIDTLEKQATIAFNQGNDLLSNQKTSEALQLRAALPWAKLQDRDPLQKTNSELKDVNTKLAPVSAMANLVLSEHRNPQ